LRLLRRGAAALLLVLDEGAVLLGGQFAVAVGISGGEHARERGMGLGLVAADAAVAVLVQVGPALALAAAGLRCLRGGGGATLGRGRLAGGLGALRERQRRGGNHSQEQQAGRGAGVELLHVGVLRRWKT